MKYICEVTDTFAGEANYSWVRRGEFVAPELCTNSLLVRRAKKAMGWTSRTYTVDLGDYLMVAPESASACIVMHIYVSHEEV